MIKNIRPHLNHERADRNDPEHFYIVTENEKGERVKSDFFNTLEESVNQLNTLVDG